MPVRIRIVPFDDSPASMEKMSETLGKEIDCFVGPCDSHTWKERDNILVLKQSVSWKHWIFGKMFTHPSLQSLWNGNIKHIMELYMQSSRPNQCRHLSILFKIIWTYKITGLGYWGNYIFTNSQVPKLISIYTLWQCF